LCRSPDDRTFEIFDSPGSWDGPMLLYLIRHAEAEDLGAGIARDFDRPLTANGREQSRALAAAFARRHIVVDTVVASPLVRAHQTAAELLAVWDPGTRPVTCDELAIERLKPAKLSDFLADLPAKGSRVPSREEKAVAAVGHMPDLGAYLEWLMGAAPGTVHMAKAAAACLRFKGDPGRATGVLEWLVSPDWFL
jgi:phosphohistidine phosphatase